MTRAWHKLAGGCTLALIIAGCGSPAAAPPTPEATVAATGVPTVARAAASPVASPTAVSKPAATAPATTAAAAPADTVWVGNTDGQGVYVRKTPLMADRLSAYPDGTALTIVGDDVDGDGQHWKHIKTPDGVEGYVPAIYTVNTPP